MLCLCIATGESAYLSIRPEERKQAMEHVQQLRLLLKGSTTSLNDYLEGPPRTKEFVSGA